jgi:hypothetical protein
LTLTAFVIGWCLVNFLLTPHGTEDSEMAWSACLGLGAHHLHLAAVNGAGAICDQKNSKFVISHQQEFMAGHMGVKGVY